MRFEFTPIVVPLFAETILLLALGAAAWRRRQIPGASRFTGLMLAVAAWSFGYALELMGTDVSTKVFWSNFKFLGIATVPLAWLTFIIHYAGHKHRLSTALVYFCRFEAAVIALLVWTDGLHGLIRKATWLLDVGAFSVLGISYGPGFWFHVAVSYITLSVGIGILLNTFLRSARIYRVQALALLPGVLAPWILNIARVTRVGPIPEFDFTPFGYAITGLTLAWALLRLQWLDVLPVVRDRRMDTVLDAILVLDANGNVVDKNPASDVLFAADPPNELGQRVEAYFAKYPALVQFLGERTLLQGEVTIEGGATPRYLDVQVAPLTNRHGVPSGRLVVLRDITTLRLTEIAFREANSQLEARVAERTAELAHANESLQAELARREAAEHAVKEANQFRDEVISCATEGIIVYDKELRYRVWNAQMENLTGLSAQGVLGQSAVELFPHLLDQGVLTLLERALSGERVVSQDLPYHVPATGKEGWVRGTYGPHHDASGAIIGVIGIVSDITENKRAEEAIRQFNTELERRVEDRTTQLASAVDALRASEYRYRGLVENAKDLIFSHDLNGRLISINATCEAVLGYTAKEFLSLNLFESLAPEDIHQAREQINRLLAGEPRAVFEIEIAAKDGVRVPLEVSYWLQTQDGKPIAVQGIARDVSERRLLEAQLQQAQKLEAIGRLAGGVAHDFNNLLTAITGFSDLLIQEAKADSLQARYLQEIHRAGKQAAALTSQLLAYSRRQQLQPKVVSLNTVVEDVQMMLQRLIGEDIRLETVLDQHTSPVVADPAQIQQILLNLAVNARDAMPQGGTLTIETHNFHIDERYARLQSDVHPGDYSLLCVADTGFGMDEATRKRIFEPFFTTKGVGEGTGLGLSMVYGVVKQSNGHVSVYSEPGYGTTFKIYLPQAVSASPELRPLAEAAPVPRRSATVLLVEDEPAVRALVREVLRPHGYRVVEAQTPRDAIAIVETGEHAFDILVTDMVMPEMSGTELAETIAPKIPGVKVLFMSGYTEHAIVQKGLLTGNRDFLSKPFAPEALLAKLDEFFAVPQPGGTVAVTSSENAGRALPGRRVSGR